MDIELGGVVNTLAEGISQRKIKEEASLAIGTVNIGGRIYQVQMTLEPTKTKHIENAKIVSEGKVVVENTLDLFPEVKAELEAKAKAESNTIADDEQPESKPEVKVINLKKV